LFRQSQISEFQTARQGIKSESCLLHFFHYSGMVQSVARGPLEPKILVRVQVPELSCLLGPVHTIAGPR
jgi:hypothetical protein